MEQSEMNRGLVLFLGSECLAEAFHSVGVASHFLDSVTDLPPSVPPSFLQIVFDQ